MEPRERAIVLVFRTSLAKASRSRSRDVVRWIYVPYDQLTDEVGPLAEAVSEATGIILIESDAWFRRRPYHRQKLATILLNQRAFAIEQAARGVTVRYECCSEAIGERLAALVSELGSLTMMEASERELRVELAPLVADGRIAVVPNETWLTSSEHFCEAGGAPYRMDRFYRVARSRLGILMDGDRPVGGRFSFDGENRERWKGEPQAPRTMRFRRGPLRDEVEHEILTRFSAHPGKLDIGAIPATRAEVRRLWTWGLTQCLPTFGPYEDAMSIRSRGLFHTRITPVLNISRILPRHLLADALAAEIPLQSKEGFVRQLIGWREFVRHVHRATDGLRVIDGQPQPVSSEPGDGGYQRWKGRAWAAPRPPSGFDGGSASNALNAQTPLPPAWWGRQSGMACLDRVVADVWSEGWSHHITRLMILSNIATLLGVSPRELTDWFWVAYADAYDWVVEPNVLAMGTYGVGELMTTKPYVSGAAYIDSMSDFCPECVFDPAKDCPVTSLYWDFLRRNDAALSDNQRMRLAMASARNRSEALIERDRRVFVHVRDLLVRGERITPQGIRTVVGGSPPVAMPEPVGTDSLRP